MVAEDCIDASDKLIQEMQQELILLKKKLLIIPEYKERVKRRL